MLLPEGIVPDGSVLGEVGYAALKDGHELIAGDMLGHVAVQVVAATLGVAHLAQDTAVGARDALDGERGAIGVDGEIHARLAVLAHVLCGDPGRWR